MHRYTRDLLGYAVALFTYYGVFVSIGLGRAIGSVVFLLLGIGTALSVILMDSIWGEGLPSLMSAALFCGLGFAGGWGGYQAALWTELLGTLFGNGMR